MGIYLYFRWHQTWWVLNMWVTELYERRMQVRTTNAWRSGLVVNAPDYHSRCRGFNPRPRHWKFEKYLAVFPTQLGDQVLVRNPGNMCLPCIGAVHWARKRTKESIRKELGYRNQILCITLLSLRICCLFSEKKSDNCYTSLIYY